MPSQRMHPRRFPTSCRLCRSMKLRCSREHPCSNCTSRGVLCEKESRNRATVAPSSSRTSPQLSSQMQINEDILERLRRLESIVLQNHPTTQRTGAFAGPNYPLSTASRIPEGEGDAKWLEGVGASEASPRSDWSTGMSFRIMPSYEVLRADVLGGLPSTNSVDERPAINVWLPPKSEWTWMLDHYAKHVESLHHVVHIPSVQALMEDLYNQLPLGFNVKPSHVALVLSIFASTTYMLSSQAAVEPFVNQQDATRYAFTCTKAALSVLEHSSRSTPGSIEDIQAAIILSFVVFNFEGFISRFRFLSSRALTMARDISLHRIDAGAHRSQERPLDLEMKRRVWYHLVSTDWLLALSGGPQEGTYFIHPNHTRVNHPRHIDDVDIDNDASCDPPLSHPTGMTYSLLRIRLAEICRTVVDTLPPSFSDWGCMDYATVISLDQNFEGFLRDLPFSFRMDESRHSQTHEIDFQYPQMGFQRSILASTVHSRRCKLNQPFLTRVLSDRRYEYSRHVCLKSAKSVIKINHQMQNDAACSVSLPNRLATFIHTFFLATAVLVMDLCINTPLVTEDQRQQVAEACRMLKTAEESSPVASHFLKSLTDILHKYRVQLSHPSTIPSANTTYTREFASTNARDPEGYEVSMPQEPLEIDGLWRDFIDLDHNPTSWDNLFSDLDATF